MLFYRFAFFLGVFFTLLAPIHADETEHASQVQLQATASRAITPDLMRITLYSEIRDKDAARLAKKTTQALNSAIEKARQVAGITIQSGNRNSYPIYDDKNRKIIAWQEQAELHLASDDFAALSALSTDLMEDLKISDRQFLISKTLMRETENALMEEAITAFSERAQIITKSLNGKSYKIMQLGVDGKNNGRSIAPRSTMLMASPADAIARQQIEAGTSDIVVSIQGVIEVAM